MDRREGSRSDKGANNTTPAGKNRIIDFLSDKLTPNKQPPPLVTHSNNNTNDSVVITTTLATTTTTTTTTSAFTAQNNNNNNNNNGLPNLNNTNFEHDHGHNVNNDNIHHHHNNNNNSNIHENEVNNSKDGTSLKDSSSSVGAPPTHLLVFSPNSKELHPPVMFNNVNPKHLSTIESQIKILNKNVNSKPVPIAREPSFSKLTKLDALEQQSQQQPQQSSNDDQASYQTMINEEMMNLQGNDMKTKVYINRLKTENEDLKKQLNVVLHDNGEQWENALHLKSIIEELGQYADQQDVFVKELRNELVTTTELLLNHHEKIYNLSELLTDVDNQKMSLSMVNEENERLKIENESLKDITDQLDLSIASLNKELYFHKDFTIDGVMYKMMNGINPTGIEKFKTLQEKESLLVASIKIYKIEFQDNPLLTVILYLKETLSWKLFIQLLRNNYEALEYFIRYCKSLKLYDDLVRVYRETRNPLEEGLAMIKQIMCNNDVNRQVSGLHAVSLFYDKYDHLSRYRDAIDNYINCIRNGVNLNLDLEINLNDNII